MSKKVYCNPKQIAFLRAKQKRRTFVGGRGCGKSATIGFHNYQCFNYMPRGKRFLAALTYDQLLTKTLASAMETWDTLGLKEYDPKTRFGHYVVCVKPPAHWPKPYSAPRTYEHMITFINGYTIELLSMERPDGRRGGSYDGGDIDESALLKEEVMTKILMPSVRGNQFRFNHYLKDTVCDFTSAAWLPSGQWIYKTEELAKELPDEYLFIEANVYDNVHAYGKDRIEMAKRSTPTMEWNVEYMNIRLQKVPNAFYPAFSEEKHCRFRTFNYQVDDRTGLWLTSDSYLNPVAPLETSWDFNAAFTSLIVCQEEGNEFKTGGVLYVEDGEDLTTNKIDTLTDRFADAYESHHYKTVFIHGDRNGNNKNPQSEKTFYQQIQERLEKRGWVVHIMVRGLDPDHLLKHKYLNAILQGDNPRLPTVSFNQNKCKYLIMSISMAPMTPDWKKDKKSERKGDQKIATHLSDCWDNIVFRKYSHLFEAEDLPSEVYFLGR